MQRYLRLVGAQQNAQRSIKPTAAATLLASFTAHLARKFCTPSTVSDYVTTLGVTATQLSRVYNSKLGVTASRLVQQTKLYKAPRLLADRGIGIQDVAIRAGFERAPYFTSVFQLQTGQNPTSFRAQTRAALCRERPSIAG